MHLLTRERQGGVEWWTLNRPQKMNALSSAGLVTALAEAARAVRADASARVVVVTGAGRAFSAGADLEEALAVAGEPGRFLALLETWRSAFRELELLPLPVLGAVNGLALAGGLELALACDLIVASTAARLGDGHIRYGLVPGGGGSQRLADAIGVRAARWLMYWGALLEAEPARQLGLVQQVLPAEGFRAEVQRIASEMVVRSSTALRFMKRMTRQRAVSDLDLQAELEEAARVAAGPDARAGLEAFVAREEPVFPTERVD
jgi:enoyl-CoA hydratase/carnithine racemase